jgi:hypothetical protein
MRWIATSVILAMVMLMAADAIEQFTRERTRYRTRLAIVAQGFGIAGGILMAWRVGAR